MSEAVTSSELLARIAAGWRAFRVALWRVGPHGMEEMTAAGWRYRDLVAHVAAWEAETARRLRAFRERGEQPPPSAPFDAFNEHAVAERKGLSLVALFAELDDGHRGLLEEVAALSEAQVRHDAGWAVAVVAGNTYEHYAEHATELEVE